MTLEHTMKITFVGDIFPSDEPLTLGFGIKSKFEEKSGDNWRRNIQAITTGSDIVIGNLESPLLDDSKAKKNNFYGVPKFATFLANCGFNVLNVANNHILEHGKTGYEETLKILRNNRIKVVGDKNKVLYIQKGICKIAIAGFCSAELESVSNNACYSTLNEQNIQSALDEINANQSDLNIFCFHWGNEYIHKPSMSQRKLAYKLIDSGVDVIIGHHPHVIQPYEKYKNSHIFYSLGNFCFDNPFQSRQFSKGMGVSIIFNAERRTIQDIKIFGIQLLYNDLMKRMDSSLFNRYFRKIQKRYETIKNHSEYDALYKGELKKRHLTERILMKLSLITLLGNVQRKEHKLFWRNLKQLYFKIY